MKDYLSEFNIVLGTSIEETQKKLDKALKEILKLKKLRLKKKSESQKTKLNLMKLRIIQCENERNIIKKKTLPTQSP